MGLLNQGIDYHLDYLLTLQESQPERTFFLSLVGLSPGETHILLETILDNAFTYFDKPLGIKLPPYFDIAHFDQAAKVFNRYLLKFVNCVNSIGNGMYIEDESVVIRPKNGFGGIGGQYIKPTALANVHAFYQRLDPSIQVIGTGGVYSGRDAFEHILCGASMVQIGTALHQQGVDIFERVSLELKAIMAQKGYEKLEDFKGKLKYFA